MNIDDLMGRLTHVWSPQAKYIGSCPRCSAPLFYPLTLSAGSVQMVPGGLRVSDSLTNQIEPLSVYQMVVASTRFVDYVPAPRQRSFRTALLMSRYLGTKALQLRILHMTPCSDTTPYLLNQLRAAMRWQVSPGRNALLRFKRASHFKLPS